MHGVNIVHLDGHIRVNVRLDVELHHAQLHFGLIRPEEEDPIQTLATVETDHVVVERPALVQALDNMFGLILYTHGGKSRSRTIHSRPAYGAQPPPSPRAPRSRGMLAVSGERCRFGSMELMDRRSLGLSGVDISRVGLGGYELGPEPGEEPDVDRAERVIKTAIANGVNWLDTSENYLETRNESVIGPALRRIEDDFLIASKVAPAPG